MDADTLVNVVSGLAGGGVLKWLYDVWRTSHRDKEQRAHRVQDFDLQLLKHRDELTMQMLSRANEQIATLSEQLAQQVDENKNMFAAARHLQEAIDLIREMVEARDQSHWVAVERRARNFLERTSKGE